MPDIRLMNGPVLLHQKIENDSQYSGRDQANHEGNQRDLTKLVSYQEKNRKSEIGNQRSFFYISHIRHLVIYHSRFLSRRSKEMHREEACRKQLKYGKLNESEL